MWRGLAPKAEKPRQHEQPNGLRHLPSPCGKGRSNQGEMAAAVQYKCSSSCGTRGQRTAHHHGMPTGRRNSPRGNGPHPWRPAPCNQIRKDQLPSAHP
jgi:hypothetical protein